MGGGKGGGGGSKLGDVSEKLFKEGEGFREEAIAQGLEILRQGAANAQIPTVQRAVEQGKAAESTANQQLQEFLVASGLDRTPFGAQATAEQAQTGAFATAAIPTGISQQFLGQLISPIFQQPSFAVSGLAAQEQANASRHNARMAALGSILSSSKFITGG